MAERIETAEFDGKSKFLCRFCGGKTCSKEDPAKNKNPNAFDGLHSNWINDDIIAM